MKIFFYMGRNEENKSGLSWKIWKVQTTDRVVTVYWGAAKLVNRRPIISGKAATKAIRFKTAAEARSYEQKQIRSKEQKGYERSTRWRQK